MIILIIAIIIIATSNLGLLKVRSTVALKAKEVGREILVTGALDLMSAHEPRLWETVSRRTCAVGFL